MIFWLILFMMLASVLLAIQRIVKERKVKKYGEVKTPIRDQRLRNRRR
jgi:hypothetical protein